LNPSNNNAPKLFKKKTCKKNSNFKNKKINWLKKTNAKNQAKKTKLSKNG